MNPSMSQYRNDKKPNRPLRLIPQRETVTATDLFFLLTKKDKVNSEIKKLKKTGLLIKTGQEKNPKYTLFINCKYICGGYAILVFSKEWTKYARL